MLNNSWLSLNPWIPVDCNWDSKCTPPHTTPWIRTSLFLNFISAKCFMQPKSHFLYQFCLINRFITNLEIHIPFMLVVFLIWLRLNKGMCVSIPKFKLNTFRLFNIKLLQHFLKLLHLLRVRFFNTSCKFMVNHWLKPLRYFRSAVWALSINSSF